MTTPEPTHILLVPMDDLGPDAMREIADQSRSRLPPWIRAVFVPGMRGNAVLVPVTEVTATISGDESLQPHTPNDGPDVRPPLGPAWEFVPVSPTLDWWRVPPWELTKVWCGTTPNGATA